MEKLFVIFYCLFIFLIEEGNGHKQKEIFAVNLEEFSLAMLDSMSLLFDRKFVSIHCVPF